MRRARLWLVALALIVAAFLVSPADAQGRFWVLVNGALRYTGNVFVTGAVRTGAGSNSAPSWSFIGQPTFGWWSDATNSATLVDSAGTNFFTLVSGTGSKMASNRCYTFTASADSTASSETNICRNGVAIVGMPSVQLSAPIVTAGSGTGITVNNAGELRQQVYKVTLSTAAFVANATTQDITLATLPAKTFLVHILADVSTQFACAAVCTSSTLSATVGKTAGANEYLISYDMDAAAARFGDAAAELGAAVTEASIPTAIGDLGSWASTQAVIMRATSGTGNWGNGAATNLSAGSVTFYLTTVVLP